MLGKLSREQGQQDRLDVFLSARHVALYRKLMDQRTDAGQRMSIIGELRAEMAKLRERSDEPSVSVS